MKSKSNKSNKNKHKKMLLIALVAVLVIAAVYMAMNKDTAFKSKAKQLCEEKDSKFLESKRYDNGMAVTCYRLNNDKIVEGKFFMPLS